MTHPQNTDSSRHDYHPQETLTSRDDLMTKKINGPAFGQVLTAEQAAANHERRQAELQAARYRRDSIAIRKRIEELEAKERGETVFRAGPVITAINGHPVGETA